MHSSLSSRPVDYVVDFLDCQRLERFIETLSLSQEILRSVQEVGCMLQSLSNANKYSDSFGSICSPFELYHVPEYITRTERYIRQAMVLERQAERTSLLVSSATFMWINSD